MHTKYHIISNDKFYYEVIRTVKYCIEKLLAIFKYSI